MPIFYTVDRLGTLAEGMVFENASPVSCAMSISHRLTSLFPEGVSKHGVRYFVDAPNMSDRSASIELVFELARQIYAPHLASRAQSVFATESIDSAEHFVAMCAGGVVTPKIWEVESEHYFRANMSLLRNDRPLLKILDMAEAYWKGEEGPDTGTPPFWEILLPCSARVVRCLSSGI